MSESRARGFRRSHAIPSSARCRILFSRQRRFATCSCPSNLFCCQRSCPAFRQNIPHLASAKPQEKSFGLILRTITSDFWLLVGLGRFELPTSPLSGVRSNQLSYRPVALSRRNNHKPCTPEQNWWSWSGSNRRPPECKSGALPAELQPLNPENPRSQTQSHAF